MVIIEIIASVSLTIIFLSTIVLTFIHIRNKQYDKKPIQNELLNRIENREITLNEYLQKQANKTEPLLCSKQCK